MNSTVNSALSLVSTLNVQALHTGGASMHGAARRAGGIWRCSVRQPPHPYAATHVPHNDMCTVQPLHSRAVNAQFRCAHPTQNQVYTCCMLLHNSNSTPHVSLKRYAMKYLPRPLVTNLGFSQRTWTSIPVGHDSW